MAVVLHPGWVQTDMGGPRALTSSKESAQGMLKVLAALTQKQNGGFFDFKGQEIPW